MGTKKCGFTHMFIVSKMFRDLPIFKNTMKYSLEYQNKGKNKYLGYKHKNKIDNTFK